MSELQAFKNGDGETWQMSCGRPLSISKAQLHLNGSGLIETIHQHTQPIVIPNLVEEWPVVQAAKTSDGALCDYLASYDKGMVVDTLQLPHDADGRMFYNDELTGFNFRRAKMPFKEALNALSERALEDRADTLYIGSTTVEQCLPGFLDDNPIALDELSPLGTFWLGNKSRIAAHYDAPENLICVAAGKRRVTLFPPEQVENLYIGPLHHTPAGQPISLVDFANPDFEKFPKFATAIEHALVVDLLPGDALYIPSMWWHHIEGQAHINLLVNYWWRDVPPYMGRSENTLYQALLTLKQLPPAQRKAWRALFDFYVFSDEETRFDHIHHSKQGPLGEIDENTMRQFKAWLVNHLKQ